MSGYEEKIFSLIIEYISTGLRFFDLGYILLLFLTGLLFIKYTPLDKKLTKKGKTTFILFLGVVYGSFWFVWIYKVSGFMVAVKYMTNIGISWSATVMWHRYVYKKIRKRLTGK